MIKIKIQNIGQIDGDEVVQVYMHRSDGDKKSAIKELKGFRRIHIKSGDTVETAITLPVKNLVSYNAESGKMEIQPGQYELQIGASSNDIRKTVDIIILN